MSNWDLDDGANDSYSVTNSTSSFDSGRFGNFGAFNAVLRIGISLAYSVVCAMGLLGNILVLYLNRGICGQKKNTINFFVFNLALADFHFVLVMPFWAAEVALNHTWPFGNAACKLVTFLTVLNMYASVFFLTGMSVSRYYMVVQTLQPGRAPFRPCMVKWVSLVIWLVAVTASLAPTIYSKTVNMDGKELCTRRFPKGHYFPALQHLQKITLAFIIPLVITSICYLSLVNFLRHHKLSSGNAKRESKVNKSIIILVASFFLCWLPNHIITSWGVLVKLKLVSWNRAYYITQTYVHPLTICLAHTNSCLNPIIYCLIWREFREELKTLFRRVSMGYSWMCLTPDCLGERCDDRQVAMALNPVKGPPDSGDPWERCSIMPATSTSLVLPE
ncbi:relaxin-3 receptor 1-like [Scyliorhinus canicula]|uniref:relaxin-3 receptor 1-like n=1 Tax=Scyliorhinus canicula TaxID=7830 RepID=UPI0018F79243|nr:relaxin-3 receptor 1-like [Scyliorhinus canicula]